MSSLFYLFFTQNGENMDNIANRFIEMRNKLGFNKSQLAQYIQSTPSIIGEIESGKREPSKNILMKLLNMYNININWILSGEGGIFINENKIEEIAKVNIPPLLEEPAAQERIGKDINLIKVINGDMKSKTVIQLPNELKDYEGKLIAIIQKGDDMETTIKTNSIVLCDTEGFQGQGVYVIKINNTYMVKRIALKPDYYIIYSDNKLYEPFEIDIDNEKLKIGGKVRFVANIFY